MCERFRRARGCPHRPWAWPRSGSWASAAGPPWGNDTLFGGRGADYALGDGVFGGPGTESEDLGNDALGGGDDTDRLVGDNDDPFGFPTDHGAELSSGGNDALDCGPAADSADGGPGHDTTTACDVTVDVESIS